MAEPLRRWMLTTCLRWLLVLLPSAAAANDTLQVDARRVGDLVEVHAQALVAAPLAVVWGTLTDYERLPQFIPGLSHSRILSRQGPVTVVEQAGEARFLFLTVPIEVTMESTERPPYIEVRRIGGTLRHLQGRYEALPQRGTPERVLLRWVGQVAPEVDLPPLIGETLIRLQIEAQFAGMVQEIQRRAQAQAGGGGLSAGPAPRPAATAQNPPAPQR